LDSGASLSLSDCQVAGFLRIKIISLRVCNIICAFDL
jgi:hypothetical protein